MSTAGTLMTWVALLVLLGLEFWAGKVPGWSWAPPAIGVAMATLVALFFMHLFRARGAAAIFATAGLFWLLILLGMGSLDRMTRHDIPVPTQTEP